MREHVNDTPATTRTVHEDAKHDLKRIRAMVASKQEDADDDDENHEDDEKLERCCLQMAIEETSVEPSNRWRLWAFQLALFALVKSS